jgi:hypothetical protein
VPARPAADAGSIRGVVAISEFAADPQAANGGTSWRHAGLAAIVRREREAIVNRRPLGVDKTTYFPVYKLHFSRRYASMESISATVIAPS